MQDDGTLVFYDFGMSGRVDPFVQDKIIDFYAAVADQDIDAILDALIEMGTLSPEADRQVMGDVMELAIADARGEDIEQYRVQQIIQQVEDTIYEFPLRLPANLALVLRVATVVEGVCVTLDEDFDFIGVATDYLREEGYLAEGVRNFVEDRATEVSDAARSAVRIPPKLESALDRVEREDFRVQADIEDSDGLLATMTKRLILGMLLASTLFSTAFLYTQASLPALVSASLEPSGSLWRCGGRSARKRPSAPSRSSRDRVCVSRTGRAEWLNTSFGEDTDDATAVTERRVRLLGQSRFSKWTSSYSPCVDWSTSWYPSSR